jgi:hypothetical protein
MYVQSNGREAAKTLVENKHMIRGKGVIVAGMGGDPPRNLSS